MSVRQSIINAVRVFVRVIIGAGVAWAIDRYALDIDSARVTDTVVLAIDAAIVGVVSGLLLALEQKVPFLARVLSLGTNGEPAAYAPKAPVSG